MGNDRQPDASGHREKAGSVPSAGQQHGSSSGEGGTAGRPSDKDDGSSAEADSPELETPPPPD